MKRTGGVIAELISRGVVAVVRQPVLDDPLAIVDALAGGGITVIEFTCTSPDAAAAVAEVRRSRPDVTVGLGTIRTVSQVADAAEAGAHFGVSPHLDSQLIAAARSHGLFYVPGVFSVSELASALQLRCELVKLYPARLGGRSYLSDLLAVFPEARVMVTGGIGVAEVGEWLAAGAKVVGLGSALTGRNGSPFDGAAVTRLARAATGTPGS